MQTGTNTQVSIHKAFRGQEEASTVGLNRASLTNSSNRANTKVNVFPLWDVSLQLLKLKQMTRTSPLSADPSPRTFRICVTGHVLSVIKVSPSAAHSQPLRGIRETGTLVRLKSLEVLWICCAGIEPRPLCMLNHTYAQPTWF